MVADFCILASHKHLNLSSECGILHFLFSELTMNILRKCEDAIAQAKTDEERVRAVCACLHAHGAPSRKEFMKIFDLLEGCLSEETNEPHIYEALTQAQVSFIDQQVQKKADVSSLIEEFYDELLYENPDFVWFERMKQWGVLREIKSQDFPHLFDECQNSEKLAAILTAGLMDVEEELFGVQSWLTTNLAHSKNIFALRAFGQSLPSLLEPWADDFCQTTQTLLEEMAHYGLYSHPYPREEGDAFFCELLDHSSHFNQSLPTAARINHVSLVQRLDLLLHDSLGPVLTDIVWPVVERHAYPSAVVVQYLGNHLSDHWTNQDINYVPQFPSATSTEWEDVAFHHFLRPLSEEHRAQILYMALGRMRPKSSLGNAEHASIAHLPWIDEAWDLRPKSFAEDRWDEHKDNNLCNYMVASRSQQACEQWIAILMTGLNVDPAYFLDNTNAASQPHTHNEVVCTPWPAQWVRNHPLIQHELLRRSISDGGVSAVKKM